MAYAFTTPVARIVGGDPYRSSPVTDPRTKAVKTLPDGRPQTQQYLAAALPKSDPEVIVWKAACDADARAAWPQWFNGPGGACTNPTFSSKIIDGDGTNSRGQSYKDREGYAGCWVVKFTRQDSAIGPVPVHKHNGQAWMQTNPGDVKCGDYVKVQGETKSNAPAQTDGMYMNMGMVAFWQEGKAIITGPSADDAFGAAPPPGAGTPSGQPYAGPTDATSGVGAPPPVATPGYSGYMDPAAPPPPPGNSAIPAPVMTAKAAGITREAYHAKGWTDDLLMQHGYMVA